MLALQASLRKATVSIVSAEKKKKAKKGEVGAGVMLGDSIGACRAPSLCSCCSAQPLGSQSNASIYLCNKMKKRVGREQGDRGSGGTLDLRASGAGERRARAAGKKANLRSG